MTTNLGPKLDQDEENKSITVTQPAFIEKKLVQYGLDKDVPKTLPGDPNVDLEDLVNRAGRY